MVSALSTLKPPRGVLDKSPVMKTVPRFHLYVLDGEEPAGLRSTGLETERLAGTAQVEQPALILLPPGGKAPGNLEVAAVEVPADTSPSAVREIVRVAVETVASTQQDRHL